MVGYFTASIKNVRDARVGDTVTEADRPCAEALPGYKKVTPMVYCGVYPADGAHYQDLREAIEKLQLNDTASEIPIGKIIVSESISTGTNIQTETKEVRIRFSIEKHLPFILKLRKFGRNAENVRGNQSPPNLRLRE